MPDLKSSSASKEIEVRKWQTVIEEVFHAGGPRAHAPLRKVAVGAVIPNPYAGTYYEDLGALIEFGRYLGRELGRRAVAAMGDAGIQSYGKGAIAGLEGEQEHAVACITSAFGDAFREQIGGGLAWISSVTKVGAVGCSIDVPLAYKDDVWIRSHYDAMTVVIADAPNRNELVVWGVVASAGRLHHRVGGKSLEGSEERR